MKNKFFLLTVTLVFGVKSLYAQVDTLFWNKEIAKIATPTSNAGWINIKPEVFIASSTFFINEKKKHLVLGKTMKCC